MGDMIDGLRAAGDATKYLKEERRKLAATQFDEATALADSLGLQLQRFSDTHYRIRTNAIWFPCFWNIHPGNQRIQRSSPECPLLHFTDLNDWTLLTIVSAADRAIKRFLERITDHGKEASNPIGPTGNSSSST